MELSDEAAVLAVRAGNRDAFRVLVERYSRSVFRLGYRMTGNEQDAEDVVQEAFLRAYKQLSRYESRSSFSTWLYRIAANYSLDLIRARRKSDDIEEVTLTEGSAGPERLFHSSQVQETVGRGARIAHAAGADGVRPEALRGIVDRGDQRDARNQQ